MRPYQHQTDISQEGYIILKKYGLVYLGMEERTGKTLTSILLAELTSRTNVLVLTKKKALDGWNDTLANYSGDGETKFTVTNYHQANKLSAVYDLIILDESHSYLSAYPKTGKLWKDVKRLTTGLPIIYLSATPYAQGPNLLFNQFRLSSFSPFKRFSNFYRFFDVYGVPDKIRTPYGLQETYKKCKPSVIEECKHLFITYTRRELNFDHEPEDVLHYVELSDNTKGWYNSCLKEEVFKVAKPGTGGQELQFEIPLDSPMKLRTTLHMIEGGVAKDEDTYYQLSNCEKVEAIKKDFGDTKELVIMYHYTAEGEKLRKHFKNAVILQGTSYAEGVDLSGYENLVIYSQDFSTARHSQRRARQANKKRDTPIKVHFYLVKSAISDQVYTTVSKNKTNFIDSLFEREEL